VESLVEDFPGEALVGTGPGGDALGSGETEPGSVRIIGGHKDDFVRAVLEATGVKEGSHVAAFAGDDDGDAGLGAPFVLSGVE
jgi:hypothetical protein